MHAIASTQASVVAAAAQQTLKLWLPPAAEDHQCDVHGKSSGTAENDADRHKKPLEVSHDTVTICMMTLQVEEGGVLLCQV